MAGLPPNEDEEFYQSSKKLKAVKVDHTYIDYSQHHVPFTSASSSEGVEGGRKKPTFPTKLHEILSNPEYRHIIGWMPHGRSWIIVNRELFIDHVLGKHFTSNKFESFNRQVNGWGLKRFYGEGPDARSYYHELFLRGRPELTKLMTRLVNPGKRIPDKANEPDLYRISRMYPLPPGPTVKIRGIPRDYFDSNPPQALTYQQPPPPALSQHPNYSYQQDPRAQQPAPSHENDPNVASRQVHQPYFQNAPYQHYSTQHNASRHYNQNQYKSPAQRHPPHNHGYYQNASPRHQYYQQPPGYQHHQHSPHHYQSQTYRGEQSNPWSTPARQGASYSSSDEYRTSSNYRYETPDHRRYETPDHHSRQDYHHRSKAASKPRQEYHQDIWRERRADEYKDVESYARKNPPQRAYYYSDNPSSSTFNYDRYDSSGGVDISLDSAPPCSRDYSTGRGTRSDHSSYRTNTSVSSDHPMRNDADTFLKDPPEQESVWTPPRSKRRSRHRKFVSLDAESKDYSDDDAATARTRHSAPAKFTGYETSSAYHHFGESEDERKPPAKSPQKPPYGRVGPITMSPICHRRTFSEPAEVRLRSWGEEDAHRDDITNLLGMHPILNYQKGLDGSEEDSMQEFVEAFSKGSPPKTP